MNNQLSTVAQGSLANIDPEKERNFIDTLLKSKALPKHVSSFEIAFTIVSMGRSVGFDAMQSIQWITSIQGQLTIGAKGIGVLLAREGYNLTVLHDADYVLEDKSYQRIVDRYKDEKDGQIYDRLTGKRILDRVTVIRYERKMPDGTLDSGEIDYFWSDARTAQLTDKEVWQKYPKAMMQNRCKTKLASYKGLLFLPETEEYAISQGVNIDLNEKGEVIEI